MTVVIIVGVLTFAVGLLVLRPSPGGRRVPAAAAADPAADLAEDRRRELLRQLRDLDDDLAAGKLARDDHARLRGPVEREAAALLATPVLATAVLAKEKAPHRGQARRLAGAVALATPSTPAGPAEMSSPIAGPAGSTPPHGSGGARATGRWRRRGAIALALAGASAGVTVLLAHTVTSRTAGETLSGSQAGGAVPAASAQPAPAGQASPVPASPVPASPAPAGSPGAKAPTRQQLEAVAEAEAQVKQNPKSVSAHLALAGAYLAAGSGQLAAVEYLAVTQLDPGNAEANTSLALLAFEVGQAKQALTMVNRALAASPSYPEGLYVRGLIELIGLRQPKPAVRDLNAYLKVAPFGSHRTNAVTLIAVAQGQDPVQGQK